MFRRVLALLTCTFACLAATATIVVLGVFASPLPSLAQTARETTQEEEEEQDPTLRFRLPDVTVRAQKEPEDKQKLPVSVTAVSRDTIERAGIHMVSDAAIYAPNTFFTEFTARKLSNARFRGIGASPNNPSVTTYIDGVPQMNANASSIELLAVDQIELVRGPQGALFGRNTLGGLINITTTRPSQTRWTGALSVPLGNHGAWTVGGGVSGPLVADKLSLGVSLAQVTRDGFTLNDVTGNDLDSRSALSGKGQLLWTPNASWEARIIVTTERARDGDYALHDLAALRARPFHAARDFEGRTDRDIFATTIQTRRTGGPITFSTTTGLVRWTTQDVTDLDYTSRPLVTRDNEEKALQVTQEVRLASAEHAPVTLSERATLMWQTGVFLFSHRYDQDAVNTYAPFLLAPSVGLPVTEQSPLSELDDFGLGVFGQGTVTFRERFDLTAGARIDYEDKSGRIETGVDPPISAPTIVAADETFANVSPQLAAAYRVRPEHTIYATVGRGFKAGGFNAASPSGNEAYGEERAWHIEGGVKTAWGNGRVRANAAVFYIDWDDLQLNVPNPAIPAQFYISNVGGAVSRGVEVDVSARLVPGVDVFTAVGYTHARFSDNSASGGVDVGGNKLPNTPDYTASAGVQYSRELARPATLYARADVVFYGSFEYDEANTQGQGAYSLVNFRGGVGGSRLFAEAWIRNAFDRRYIPLAFAYESFAPSGFVGEAGAPRTLGLSAGVRF